MKLTFESNELQAEEITGVLFAHVLIYVAPPSAEILPCFIPIGPL